MFKFQKFQNCANVVNYLSLRTISFCKRTIIVVHVFCSKKGFFVCYSYQSFQFWQKGALAWRNTLDGRLDCKSCPYPAETWAPISCPHSSQDLALQRPQRPLKRPKRRWPNRPSPSKKIYVGSPLVNYWEWLWFTAINLYSCSWWGKKAALGHSGIPTWRLISLW